MKAFLSRYLDRTLPATRPDESFFAAGPVRPRKPRPTHSVRAVRPVRRVPIRRHGHQAG